MLERFRGGAMSANVISGVALVFAMGGGAYAITSIPGPDGVIHGCYQRTTGNLRLVSADQRCAKSERAIAWNQSGPRANMSRRVVIPRSTGKLTIINGRLLVEHDLDVGADLKVLGRTYLSQISTTYAGPLEAPKMHTAGNLSVDGKGSVAKSLHVGGALSSASLSATTLSATTASVFNFTGTNANLGGYALVGGSLTSASLNTGPLTATNGNLTGHESVGGALSSASLTTGPLSATTATFSGNLTGTNASLSGAASVGGALSSASLTTGPLSATTGNFSGNLTGTNASLTGTASVGGALSSASLTTGPVTATSANLQGGSLTNAGPLSAASLSTTGDVSVGGNLNVTGRKNLEIDDRGCPARRGSS